LNPEQQTSNYKPQAKGEMTAAAKKADEEIAALKLDAGKIGQRIA